MANANKMTAEETKLQGILSAYLTSRKGDSPATPHLDQDTLAAFSEGTLNKRESGPVVSHLADCGFCRHITAELVRLDLAFAEEPVSVTAAESISQPSKISGVLSGLFEKIFGNYENAVFAHEEKKEKDDAKDTKDED
jgi:hypothetical protein